MSFFRNFKRALGFSGDDDDNEDPLYADTTLDSTAPAPSAASGAPKSEGEPAPRPVELDPEIRTRIFEKVVSVFDAALPEFLGRSVDPAAQRRYLLESMDADIKAYIDSLRADADAVCRHEWESRQASLSAELETVRRRAAEVEAKEAEARQKQLSADRQRAALSARVHDLENTVGRLEADREQYELENRSLVNRLKVAGIQGGDAQKAVEEATAELRAQVEEMTVGIDSLKEQQHVSDELLADTRRRLKERETELGETKSKLEESEKLLAEFDALSGKMDSMDEALAARDSKIQKLQKKLAAREEEVESLRRTVTENLKLHAEREQALRAELDTLKSAVAADTPATYGAEGAPELPSDEPVHAADDSPAPRISESDLAALEESFQSEDWFTKTPPAETPSMRSPEAEAEFGYHPPRKKAQVHNPDQLSLF